MKKFLFLLLMASSKLIAQPPSVFDNSVKNTIFHGHGTFVNEPGVGTIAPTNSPATTAQWHFAGNNIYHITPPGGGIARSWDWVYSIIATDKKEYIACGYTGPEENSPNRGGVIFKLDHYGQLVWSKTISSYHYGSGTLDHAPGVLWQVTKANDGYVAVGYTNSGQRLVVVEVDEDGTFLNGTPRALDFPMDVPPDVNISNVSLSYSAVDYTNITPDRMRGNAVIPDPEDNSVNKIIVAGQCKFIDSTHSKEYDLAYITKLEYSGGSWNFVKRVVCGNQTATSLCFPIDNWKIGGNRILKMISKPKPGGGYDLYMVGAKSGSIDHTTHCGESTATGTTDIQILDKDVWVLGMTSDLSTVNFERTYNRGSIRLDGTSGSGPFISTVSSATYPYSEVGPLSARHYDPSSGSLLHTYGGVVRWSPATKYLNAENNVNEEGQDIIFTADGNLAITAAVNIIGATSANNGFHSGGSFWGTGTGVMNGMALGWGKEYQDCDGFLLKLNMTGELLKAKNVGHFSGKVFNLCLGQDLEGHYIVAGSTADNYGNVDPYNLPAPPNLSGRAFIVATDDNFPGADIMRRSYVDADSRATDINSGNDDNNIEDDFCVFSMALTADGGYVIGGNNGRNNDDFTITKFAPLHQQLLVRASSGGYEKFGGADIPSTYYTGTSEMWNSNKKIASKVVILSGSTLTISGCEISFAASDHLWDYWAAANAYSSGSIGCGIVVEPGGKLVLNNATLQGIGLSNEHNMWDGVVVHGTPTTSSILSQGTVVMNGSTIKDARYGLYVSDNYRTYVKLASSADVTRGVTYSSRYNGYATMGGGRITVDNCTFLNCRNGINFQNYPNYANSSKVTNSTFTADAAGVGDINFYTDKQGRLLTTNTHFAAWAVRNMALYGNTFTCDLSFPVELRPNGVIASATGITIGQSCSASFPIMCWPPAIPGNTFSNLGRALVAEYPTGVNPPLLVTQNTFDNNITAMDLQGGSHNMVIRQNSLLLPEGTMDWHPTGITLASCRGYEVAENTFDKCSTCGSTSPYMYQNWGIVVNGGHIEDELLNKNTFEEVHVANIAIGKNGYSGSPKSGLQFKCNNYDKNIWGIMRSSRLPDGSISPCTIHPKQGSCMPGSSSSAAGNQFHTCNSGAAFYFGRIYAGDANVSQQVDYFNNATGSIFDPSGCIAITNPYSGGTVTILTNTGCTVTPPNIGDACPTPKDYSSDMIDGLQAHLDELGPMITNSNDPDLTEALLTDRNLTIDDAARYYVLHESYSDAGSLLASTANIGMHYLVI